MSASIKYFVFENDEFIKVNEKEYNRWHKEEWPNFEPPMFSKIIEGLVYTAQAFYNGDVTKGNRLKPFTIYLIEGNKHKIRYFRKWISFSFQYEKLINRLSKIEIQHLHISNQRRNKVLSIAAMATIRI